MSNEKNKDILRTFQPDFCKNLRTSKAQKESTGPYKIKKVYLKWLDMNRTRIVMYHDYT